MFLFTRIRKKRYKKQLCKLGNGGREREKENVEGNNGLSTISMAMNTQKKRRERKTCKTLAEREKKNNGNIHIDTHKKRKRKEIIGTLVKLRTHCNIIPPYIIISLRN